MGAGDRAQLAAAIAAQESLRGQVVDEVLDAAIAGLRAQMQQLTEDRRRRQVTVLFGDVVGFTAMAESMDAEDLTVLMDDLWSVLDGVIADHAGSVDKHIGDAVMAIWGADATREDDPELAIRAAIDLQAALDRFRLSHDLELVMRVGVNTGPVVLGRIGTGGEFTAMGDAVNVASRLEHAAPPGGILVSHDTYRHVRGVFESVARAPLTVRGKSEALRVYEIHGVKPRSFRVPSRGVEGVETTTVGRQHELQTIVQAFSVAHDSSVAVLVEVIGDAGIGKSRLLWEFGNWLETQPVPTFFFSGRALAPRRSVPLALVRDVVAARCQIADSDSPHVVVSKIISESGGALADWDAAVMAHWLGFGLDESEERAVFPEGERLSAAGRAHLVTLLRSFAAQSPVVIMLEDLHWADASSLDVLAEARDRLRDLPVLLVATTRPTERSRTSGLLPNGRNHRRIELGPLSAKQSHALVEEILQRADDVPESLIELVVARSEGNAFYIEELVKMLIDDGAIETDSEPWLVTVGASELARVPSTLTGVLQARLDSLPETTRRSLQAASIVGRIFWDDAVRELADDRVELQPAIDRELIFERTPAFAHCAEFIFKHAILHDVTYETVLLSERPQLHALAARWLERTVGPRRDEFLVELAAHQKRAGSFQEAAALLDEAAELALRTANVRTCLELTNEVAELQAMAGLPVHARTLTHAARSHLQLGDLSAADEVAWNAVGDARRSENSEALAEALVVASAVARQLGDYERSVSLLGEAKEAAEVVGGPILVRTLVQLAWDEIFSNRVPSGEHIQRLLHLAGRSGDPNLEAEAHLVAGATMTSGVDFEAGVRHLESALALSRGSGDRWGEMNALNNLGAAFHIRGDEVADETLYAPAEESYRATLELAGRLEARQVRSRTTANLAQLKLRAGDVEDAKRLVEHSMRESREIGAVIDELGALLVYAEALIQEGQVERGLAQIGMVREHAASGSLADELERVGERIPSGRAADAMVAKGYELDLDQVVAEILDDSSAD